MTQEPATRRGPYLKLVSATLVLLEGAPDPLLPAFDFAPLRHLAFPIQFVAQVRHFYRLFHYRMPPHVKGHPPPALLVQYTFSEWMCPCGPPLRVSHTTCVGHTNDTPRLLFLRTKAEEKTYGCNR